MSRKDTNLILNELIQGLTFSVRQDSNALINAVYDGTSVLNVNISGLDTSTITDFNIGTPSNGDVLVYNGTSDKWENKASSYKVYTALLTQNYVSSTSGLLEEGKTYIINSIVAGDNFDNVGYISLSAPFIATGATPTNWTNSTEVINITDSAPSAIVLENTLGEVPTFEYYSSGTYYIKTSGNIFTENKTWYIGQLSADMGQETDIVHINFTRDSNTQITISVGNNTYFIDNYLSNTPIEIRVYN